MAYMAWACGGFQVTSCAAVYELVKYPYKNND